MRLALLSSQDLSSIRQDLSSVSNSGTKASTALEFESRLRGSLESRTAQLETELTKAWEQIKELTEKVSTAETTKRHLEIELDKVSTVCFVVSFPDSLSSSPLLSSPLLFPLLFSSLLSVIFSLLLCSLFFLLFFPRSVQAMTVKTQIFRTCFYFCNTFFTLHLI